MPLRLPLGIVSIIVKHDIHLQKIIFKLLKLTRKLGTQNEVKAVIEQPDYITNA